MFSSVATKALLAIVRSESDPRLVVAQTLLAEAEAEHLNQTLRIKSPMVDAPVDPQVAVQMAELESLITELQSIVTALTPHTA